MDLRTKPGSIDKNIRQETNAAIAQSMPNLYTSNYSNQWEKGNASYSKTAMSFLKDFETDNFSQNELLAEDAIEFHFMGVNDVFDKAKVIAKLKELRAPLKNFKIRLQTIISLKSVDSEEDWVFAYGNMTDIKGNGALHDINFFQQYSFDKAGKITQIKQYEVVRK
jgi:hypothetical protein